jgi:hypothetical protein
MCVGVRDLLGCRLAPRSLSSTIAGFPSTIAGFLHEHTMPGAANRAYTKVMSNKSMTYRVFIKNNLYTALLGMLLTARCCGKPAIVDGIPAIVDAG